MSLKIIFSLICLMGNVVFAGEHRFTGFKMNFCEDDSRKICYILEAGVAEQSYFSPKLFLHTEVALKIIGKETTKFVGSDGYFDPIKDILVIKGVKNQKFTEMAFYLKDRRMLVL